MNASPLVSVVMPAYNHEKYVGEAIDSVLNQTWQHLEFIIIDDGSTDKTADIVKAYDDPRVHYFYQTNQDAYNALNAGLAKTKGDYIAIINSDDVYTLERLACLIKHMQQNQCQAIFSDVAPVDGGSQPLNDPDFGWNQWHQTNRDFYLQQPKDLYRGFLHGNLMVTTSNLLMTAQAMQTVGQFASYRYLHDYDYIFRLLNAFPNQVEYLHQKQLMHYRIHGGNTISEAAIIGREQDQEIIRAAVLAQTTKTKQGRINAGIDRLIKLEQELQEVRSQLSPQPAQRSGTMLETATTLTLAKTIVQRLLAKARGK